ncbi:Endo-1-3(4)-beta-glucanase [Penicillium taxi]|uniref:Endo-1-3(4)-beta-glucanase n=1 Tax=Penicillium taxi TaxID=168475 RepID=UPI002544F084|nr:Endo-1-3(4)-beta-glucanase [Penicillium taxi]KAJ5893318.1 Endo-1-3(4)-beta-glucanase [Penicillium taxi]
MHVLSTLIPCLGLFAQLSTAAYTIQDDYGGNGTFFDKFNFYTDADPTNGYVTYVDQTTAAAGGLIGSYDTATYIGVDKTNIASGSGRNSVRLTSINSYQHGLVILDLSHMPSSACGTWPAFWMLGPDWPTTGEIDIIEGVNQATVNQMTLHTSDGCSIQNSGFTGSLYTDNCYVEAADQSDNIGCSIIETDTQSYGDGFNNVGGGVYATEWTSAGISIYFFPRSSIPADITAGSPDPTTWGTPAASFAGGCDIDSHFVNLQIVFDLTFCGDWAGDAWSSSSCASYADTCDNYVQNNPTAFADSYWGINSLKVYQDNGYAKRGAPHPHARAHARAGEVRSPLRRHWRQAAGRN